MHIVDVFYTPLEERFERITRLARRSLNVPVAAITCVTADKQWFKSVAGWAVTELPVSHSICPLTVEENRICVINDTTEDSRVKDHPLVANRPHFRFYAGYPLQERLGAGGRHVVRLRYSATRVQRRAAVYVARPRRNRAP